MNLIVWALAAALLTGLAQAGPEEDREKFQSYFKNKFPDIAYDEFANGVYALDENQRANWEAIEEFPPYEPLMEKGEEMWNTAFANGKTYADCFGESPAVRAKYPHWDAERKEVVTLPLAINECREANGEQPLKYKKGAIADLLAYMSYESRGQATDVKVPADDPDALAAYEAGKHFYYARRGQLNLACYHCHISYPGSLLRSDILSTALGQTTGWPVYRSKWGEAGTLHRRFTGCNKQVRAKPFEAQGKEYRNLEYFLTYMNNGQKLNGPSARK
ncbi:MAG: sulfur oxidation c-type cytochrome SoxA [Pseudomonadota bacterium]